MNAIPNELQFLYRASKGRVYFALHLRHADAFCMLYNCDYQWHETYGGYQILLISKS